MLRQVNFCSNNTEVADNKNPKPTVSVVKIPESKDTVELSSKKKEQKKDVPETCYTIAGIGTVIGATGAAIGLHKANALKNVENAFSRVFTDLRETVPANVVGKLQKLTDIAVTDKLTGLYNRRKYDANVLTLVERAKQSGEKLHLAIVDFDNFKGINEMLHHTTGDVFLQIIADNAKIVSEKHGLLPYRYGGEEFIMLMSSKDKQAAKEIVDELAKNINEDPRLKEYMPKFIDSAKSRLTELKGKQAKTQAYYDFKHKTNNPILEREEGMKFLRSHVDELPESIRGKVKAEIDKIDAENLGNENIFHCINQHFHYIREINQIEDWIKHVTKVVGDKPQGFTISGGVAEFNPEMMVTPKDLLKHADKLLDQSKKMGKAIVSAD